MLQPDLQLSSYHFTVPKLLTSFNAPSPARPSHLLNIRIRAGVTDPFHTAWPQAKTHLLPFSCLRTVKSPMVNILHLYRALEKSHRWMDLPERNRGISTYINAEATTRYRPPPRLTSASQAMGLHLVNLDLAQQDSFAGLPDFFHPT